MSQTKNKTDFSSADLTVYEVKDERPSLPLPRPLNPVLPDIPGVLLFLMKCKSGKSNMVANMLNREEYYEGIFDKIIIVSPTVKIDKSSQLYFREEVEDLYEVHDDVENVNEIIQSIIDRQEEFDVNDPDNLPPRLCLVLDDISGYLQRNSLVAHIFSRYRHYNLTIFLSNQTIKILPTVCRAMATAVFLSSCYSTVEREKILDEWAEFFGGKEKMVVMWDDAVKHRFNYLYLKLDDVKPRAFQIGSLRLYELDVRTGREQPHNNLLTEEVETEPVQPPKSEPNIDEDTSALPMPGHSLCFPLASCSKCDQLLLRS